MNPIIPIEETWLLLAAILAIGLWPVWRSTMRLALPWRFASSALRLSGLTLLALLALNPGRWVEESQALSREWAVLIDRSRSMETVDVSGVSRWDAAAREVGRIERIAVHPERIRWYTFASELEGVADSAALLDRRPDGDRTRLEETLLSLLAHYRAGDRKLTGILVMGDGRRVEPEIIEDVGLTARSQETPIYALSLGGPVARPDLSVTVSRRQVIAFAGQPVRAAARIRNHGLGPRRVRLQLMDDADRRLAEQFIDLADGAEQIVAFDVPPSDAGYAEYTIVAPVLDGETITHNNRSAFGISTLPDRMQVLLVEGAPYWDSKFLAQRLRQQPNIDVTAVYRLAADRYFVVHEEEETHQTDLDTVFPVDAGALTRYDLILFGKGLDTILSPVRIEQLNRYVRDQGGRIVFFRGKPYHDRFEALETLEPLTWSSPLGSPVVFQPMDNPPPGGLFGDILPDADEPVWSRLPALKSAHQAQPRAFTEVAATGLPEDQRGIHARQTGAAAGLTPLLAWRTYGRGLLAVVNAEGFWQWDFFPETSDAQDMYQEFWIQLLQWCALRAEFMPGRDVAITLSSAVTLPDEPVRATVRRRAARTEDTPGEPRLTIWRGNERYRESSMTSGASVDDRSAPGGRSSEDRWEAIFTLPDPGLYRIEVTMGDASDTADAADAILRVDNWPTEMDNVSADSERMARLAEAAGGRLIALGDLAEIVGQMETEPQTDAEGKAIWQSAWDRASVLILVLLCFAGDIFVRRRNGLL